MTNRMQWSLLSLVTLGALSTAAAQVPTVEHAPRTAAPECTASRPAPQAVFDLEGMGRALNGWRHKGGTAAEYKSAGSNYRTYRPTVTNTPDGGLFVSTKLDHIRGLKKDDHAQVEMLFDSGGRILQARATMQIQGKLALDTGVITKNVGDRRVTAIVAISEEIFRLLDRIDDHGGRANFPAVVQHNLHIINGAVRTR